MNNFLLDIEYNPQSGAYMACFADGKNILLGASTYTDAVLEADLLTPAEYA